MRTKKPVPKIKIQWTIEVTETYEAEIDADDFATIFLGKSPTVKAILAGDVDKSDINAEELAGLEEENARQYVSVDERYVDWFRVVEPDTLRELRER